MLKSRIAPAPRPTVAYSRPQHHARTPGVPTLRARGPPRTPNCTTNGDLRIVCGCCHVDILAVEKR